MQLLGPIMNFFDAVPEVYNTFWCCETQQNVMKVGYRMDGKMIYLFHVVVIFNIRAVAFQR